MFGAPTICTAVIGEQYFLCSEISEACWRRQTCHFLGEYISCALTTMMPVIQCTTLPVLRPPALLRSENRMYLVIGSGHPGVFSELSVPLLLKTPIRAEG
jgi:hypothetical protein